jgi:hypothetical protein
MPWERRGEHEHLAYPGVYVIATPKRPLGSRRFDWTPDIVYVGMTNAVGGLASRLQQFANTLDGKRGHGGADRVRLRYRRHTEFARHAFVAVAAFRCDPRSAQPRDLRVMGNVARFEFQCLAAYVELFGRLPEFNDKRRSPKFSVTVGRT